ncbi:MAG: AMP-binding protein [Thermodesulfobacteriota bacterium]|nr:AMP-binding protein [Thermodesulfobacteriota bacterium]
MVETLTAWPKEFAAKYVRKGCWKGLTIGDIIDLAVRDYPGKEAVVSEQGRITYTQLAQRVNRLAIRLLELGIRKGDRIIVQLPNGPEFLYLHYAASKIGAVNVMALPRHRSREIGYLLNFTEASAIAIPCFFKDFNYLDMVEELRLKCPKLKYVIVSGEGIPDESVSFNDMVSGSTETKYPENYLEKFKPAATDVAFLLLTGGTTGFPKCVPRTHNDFICIYSSLARLKNYSSDRVFLVNLPLSHTAALGKCTNSCLAGATLVLRSTTRPEDTIAAIETEKVTDIMLVPTQVLDMLKLVEHSNRDLNSLRLIEIGGSYVSPDLVRRLEKKIRGTVLNALGSSEGVHFTPRISDPLEVRAETVGRPCCQEDEFRIVDEEGVDVMPGNEGELCIRSPHCIIGYYKNPEENRKAFDNEGFYHTGDLSMLDENKNIRITGRKKDLIIRGGENISAAEVEEVLCLHPKVDDVAVVGMPDGRLGEKVCAYIQPKEDRTINLKEVVNFLKENGIAIFKLPERIELIRKLPLTSIGKVDKKVLRADIENKIKKEART